MARVERLESRAILALTGVALFASFSVVFVLLLYGLYHNGGGVPPDLASGIILVSIPVTVVSSVFAVLIALLALRNRDAVDEVFLVHLSGLLLVHLSKTLKAEKDRDLLAGMLTAVQSFILEAFAKGPSRELRQMDFGKRKILLCRGTHSYLAVIVRGRRPAVFTHRVRRALAKVERAYGSVIAAWNGMAESLEGADDLLRHELMDVRLRTLARDAIDTAVDGVTLRLVRWLQRRRPLGVADPNHTQPTPRERAAELLRRPEAGATHARHQELITTALEQIEEGRFTLAGTTNVYLALALQKSPQASAAGWWDEVLLTVREVLVTWPWDPVAQAWVEPPAAPTETRPLDEMAGAPLVAQIEQPHRRPGASASRRG